MIKKRMVGLVIFVAAMFFVCTSVSANIFAKQQQAEVNYGKGVHAFFDGDYQQAIVVFRDIEELGVKDPRAYFFYALSHYRLEENDKAESLFKKAAEFEISERRFRDYNVSDAIKRIQGKERIMIEDYRQKARNDWNAAEKRRSEVKYGESKTQDKDILSTLSKPFVGTAPFGARSVDPFRKNTDEDHLKLIPSDDKMPSVVVPPLERRSVARPAVPSRKSDDTAPALPATPSAKKEEKTKPADDDPFGLSSDEKEMKTDSEEDEKQNEK